MHEVTGRVVGMAAWVGDTWSTDRFYCPSLQPRAAVCRVQRDVTAATRSAPADVITQGEGP